LRSATRRPHVARLLQIFSGTVIGPIFFEFIQRKGDDGFGEGNFRALFESIEEDQIRRGVHLCVRYFESGSLPNTWPAFPEYSRQIGLQRLMDKR
jgi:hypothetical protein